MVIGTASIIAILLLIQIYKRQFLSATTVFIGIYFCFYVLAPSVLGLNYPKVDVAAFKGSLSMLIALIFNSMIFERSLIKTKDNPLIIDIDLIDAIERFLRIITVLFLLLFLGFGGVRQLFAGIISTKSLLQSRSIWSRLFDYSMMFWGYSIVLRVIARKGCINKNLVLNLLLYTVFSIAFSFTRAGLICILGISAVCYLVNKPLGKQLLLTLIGVLIGAFLMILMGAVRTWGIRSGFSSINLSYIQRSLSGSLDFTSGYLHFGLLLNTSAKITPLVYFKFLFSFIPRTIWPNKPYASSIEIMRQIDFSTWSEGVSTGYTLLGEAYAVLGSVGTWIYPFVFIVINSICDSRIGKNIDDDNTNTFGFFMCLYFMFTFNLESFRQGVDIAIMNSFITLIPLWIINRYRFKFGRR